MLKVYCISLALWRWRTVLFVQQKSFDTFWNVATQCNASNWTSCHRLDIHVVRERLTGLQRWMFCSCSSRRIHRQRRRRYRITNGFNECSTSCPLSTGCAHPWRNQRRSARFHRCIVYCCRRHCLPRLSVSLAAALEKWAQLSSWFLRYAIKIIRKFSEHYNNGLFRLI